MASLIISQPDGNELTVPLGDALLRIGRGPENELRIQDDSVSTFHAEIHIADGQHFLKDLGSTNGVRVNGERVPQAVLADGDLLRFGNIRVSYHGSPPETNPEPVPAHAPQGMPPPSKKTGSTALANIIPGELSPDDTRLRGFGPKKSAKDPEKALYIAIGVITVLASVACLLLSFAMH